MDELKFNPSDAHFWGNCNGQPKMVADRPKKPQSDAAKEGDAIHWVAAECLKGNGDIPQNFENSEAPNGIVITPEMVEVAIAFVDPCLPYVDHGLKVEEKIEGGFGGRADAHLIEIIDENTVKLHIWDWKAGYGIVEIVDNFQFLAMSAGITLDYQDVFAGHDNILFEFTVVQPRPHHPDGSVRTWCPGSDHVFELVEYLKAQREAGRNEPTLNAGSHCLKCPAAGDCHALDKGCNDVFSWVTDFGAYDLTGAELSRSHDMLKKASKMIDARLTGVEEQMHNELTSGRFVPGFTLDMDFTPLNWDKPIEQVTPFFDTLGVEVRVPKIKTPLQTIRDLKVPEDLVKTLASRKPKPMKIVPVTGNEIKKLCKEYGVS